MSVSAAATRDPSSAKTLLRSSAIVFVLQSLLVLPIAWGLDADMQRAPFDLRDGAYLLDTLVNHRPVLLGLLYAALTPLGLGLLVAVPLRLFWLSSFDEDRTLAAHARRAIALTPRALALVLLTLIAALVPLALLATLPVSVHAWLEGPDAAARWRYTLVAALPLGLFLLWLGALLDGALAALLRAPGLVATLKRGKGNLRTLAIYGLVMAARMLVLIASGAISAPPLLLMLVLPLSGFLRTLLRGVWLRYALGAVTSA